MNDPTARSPTTDVDVIDPIKAKQNIAEAQAKTVAMINNQICDQPPTTALCAHIPKDNTDFSELFVYMFILASAQNSFDIFSWQSFIAMNWPLGSDRRPAAARIGTRPKAPRAWSEYRTPRQIFAPEYEDAICREKRRLNLPVLYTDNFIQTGGLPLIDKNLNYVVYDIRLNDVLADYIVDNGLNTVDGQMAFAAAGKKVDFPLGHYDDPVAKTGGTVGSAALKSAWKIIDTERGDDPGRYFTMHGLIPIAASQSETGEAMCLEVELGLIGMHIMQRNRSGNGADWTWSTFEHIDNAPLAENARKPIDILHNNLFDGACKAPSQLDQSYAFFDPACEDCATNTLSNQRWTWSATRPYAAAFAQHGGFGTQVVRCWKVFEGTELINQIWQEKLEGTVWANYLSLSAQWKGARRSPMIPEGEVPRFLTNTTMETYDQYGAKSSCIGCHSDARTVAGQDAKFSFLLNFAKKYETMAESDALAQE